MKILFITHDSNAYGANRSLIDLILTLRKSHGVEPIVVLPFRGPFRAMLQSESIKYLELRFHPWVRSLDPVQYSWKSWVRPLLGFWAEIRVALLLMTNRFDILHINSSATGLGTWCASLLRIPTIWHIREYLEEDFRYQFVNSRRSLKRMRSAARVLAISTDLRLKYAALLGRGIDLVHNGIITPPAEEFTRQILPESRPWRLLLVGVLHENKGHIDALEALAKLKQNGAGPGELWLVGDGASEFLERLHKRVKELGLEGWVRFFGYQSHLDDIRRESDIALVCSQREAFGRVTIEAMAAGMLVVASESGGTKDIVVDGISGLLYQSGQPTHLARVLQSALQNRVQANAIAQAGRLRQMEYFDIGITAKAVTRIYQEVLA